LNRYIDVVHIYLPSQRRGSLAGAQATVKCNPRLAESIVIHPLSYECYRIRCAVFLAETAA
jgi:hypothetical protein